MDRSFNAVQCTNVHPGHVLIVRDTHEIVYVGPINDAPSEPEAVTLFLNPVDFARLQTVVKKRTN